MDFTGERYIPDAIDDMEIEFEHMQRYLSITKLVEGKRVLDAACGEGYGSEILAQEAEKVIGIDIDEQSIERAKKKYLNPNLEFIQGSVAKLPFDEDSFDVIVSFETIEHVDQETQQLFISEVKRVLTKDGILIISTPNKENYSDARNYKNPFHIKEFYRKEFHDFLRNSFSDVSFFYQTKEEVFLLINENEKEVKNLDVNLNIAEASKYMIAICSNSSNSECKVSSFLIDQGQYNKKVQRINQLQNEVEERNKHIANLDNEIFKNASNRSDIINDYKSELSSLKEELTEKDIIIDNLRREKDSNEDLLNKQIEDLKGKIISFNQELEELKKKERLLNNIFESDGWRLLLKFYKVRDSLLPANSKLRFLMKLFKRVVLEKNFSTINKQNIKKLIYYAKNQNLSMLEARVDNYIERNTNNNSDLALSILPPHMEYEKITFRKDLEPTVSIIIPVYNQWDFTYACLKSIISNTENVTYEIIIADDMSTDETININEYVENITVIRDGYNRGFLLNCNNAAKSSKGKYILFLNNDTQVQKGWLDSLVGLIESNHEIGMVGSKLVYPDGRLQEAGGIIWDDASGWNYGRLDDPNKPEYNYVKEVDYISGAAIMINKNLWQTIGGFDERYAPAYYEDSDLAFEVRKKGYKVFYQPKSVVVHFEGISHGTDLSSNIKSYQVRNKEIFLEKWQAELNANHFKNGHDVFLAKDKSRDKKSIVVIDHYVPHFDRDAGGRCTYFYLKLFKTMGYNVIFIGDNFFKHEPYTSYLQELGIEVLYGNEYSKNIEEWFKLNGKYLDYVYLNRPHIAIKYIDMARKHTKSKIIYFGHDLHYLRELRNYEVEAKPELLKSSMEWKKIEFELFNKTDVIHVVGSYEQELLKKEFPNKPIRNIPLYMFSKEEINKLRNEVDNRENILFVGGFNHKPNYDAVFWFIKEVYPSIVKKKPEMKFYIVGSNPPEDIVALQSKNIIVTGYVTEEELIQYYNNCKIVVVPLRYGAGVKGKVVEAISYQVPIVTTSIGAEGLIDIENYLLIANDSKDFSDKILELYDNDELWKELSIKSKEYIDSYFTINAAREQINLDIN